MTNKPKLAGCDVIKKQKIKLGEPCRDFQELFGSPINMSSKSSEQKLQIPKQETKGKFTPQKYQRIMAELQGELLPILTDLICGF
jgi:hypothetical protein